MLSLGLTAALTAGPVFLGIETDSAAAEPLLLAAGRKTTLTLTLSAGTPLTPELAGDLTAITGSLAAPLAAGLKLELRRAGAAKAGIQRFAFDLDLPAVERKQAMVLRLRLRPEPGQDWLPLPPVSITAAPSAWREALRAFVHAVPCGRIEGDETLPMIFAQAELDVPAFTAGQPIPAGGPRVIFAVGDQLLAEGAGPDRLWIVFKPGRRGPYEVQRATPGAPLTLVVNDRVLRVAQDDAGADETLGRVLNAAYALSGTETPLSQP